MSDLFSILRNHKSIRSFKDQPIPDELVEQVLADALVGTSSSGNLNSVSIILTRDRERKAKLCEYHSGQEMILEAPLLITFCADWFRTREWLRHRGARDNFGNLLGYHVGLIDAAIMAQSVSLGFEAHGLGICYLGTTLNSMAAIAEYLELPETCVPITTIVVGYPNENPDKRDRLPLNSLVHDEVYHHPSREDIDATYAQREVKGWARYMSIPSLKEAAEQLGVTSLAQFYTSDAKYDPASFEEISSELLETLKRKRFLP